MRYLPIPLSSFSNSKKEVLIKIPSLHRAQRCLEGGAAELRWGCSVAQRGVHRSSDGDEASLRRGCSGAQMGLRRSSNGAQTFSDFKYGHRYV